MLNESKDKILISDESLCINNQLISELEKISLNDITSTNILTEYTLPRRFEILKNTDINTHFT